MPALNPFILKGSLSGSSEEVIKLTSLSLERNFFLISKNPRWARQPGGTAPSAAEGAASQTPRRAGDPWLWDRPLLQLFPALLHSLSSWGRSYSALKFDDLIKPQIWGLMISNEISVTRRCDIWLPKQMVLFLVFIFFRDRISLFFSTGGGREDFEVNNVLCISCHLNEYMISFWFVITFAGNCYLRH